MEIIDWRSISSPLDISDSAGVTGFSFFICFSLSQAPDGGTENSWALSPANNDWRSVLDTVTVSGPFSLSHLPDSGRENSL